MGQGYSLTTLPAGSAGIDVPEMQDLQYEKSLGNARFMKCIRARRKQEGLVVAKVVMKPYPDFRLQRYIRALHAERKELIEIPNTLAYHYIIETPTNGYLIRQYINSSLYDRISTRPFLEDIEKKWIAFQLLCAVRDCHNRSIYHGDIKSENILVTSWNWVYLSDFSSSFKPTYLPEDNPADFSFFFDTSGRRTCYIAPERFFSPGEDLASKSNINWAMDIFSVGCVIAELFLESPIFTLSQLFKYRSNKEYDPTHIHLERIADKEIREMITHMISLDPQDRYSAEEYLTFWKARAFPEYFYNFLHQYMHVITDPSSGRTPLSSAETNFGESDDRIDRIYHDLDKISYFLGYGDQIKLPKPAHLLKDLRNPFFTLQPDIFPANSKNYNPNQKPKDDGTLIFLTIIVNSLKHTARASSKLKACDLLLAFAERLTDEAKLDRILPYLVAMLQDKSEVVKTTALRSLTQLLTYVSVVSPANSYIFPDYLLPRLQHLMATAESKQSILVRATYALCLGSLATSASKFLDMRQAFNTKNSLNLRNSLMFNENDTDDGTISRSVYQNMFDIAREDIVAQFETHAKALLTDSDPSVRRAFLPSVSALCVFLGKQRASDVILSHLNTYLNDRDWLLKLAFFQTIVGVATYVGSAGLEGFILPLMVQALTDPEEHVVEAVIRSFSAIARLGLFQRPTTWEMIDIVSRFTMHPNIWIREAAAQFIASTTSFTISVDPISIVTPRIIPYFRASPKNFEILHLLDALKQPVPRIVLELATTWAKASDQTLFWKAIQKPNIFSFSFGDNIQMPLSKAATKLSLQKITKSAEDEGWIERLRNAGLAPEDESKLLALQEYIWRSAHRKPDDETTNRPHKFSKIVNLTELQVTLQNVFFDNSSTAQEANKYDDDADEHPRTIAEALYDATTSSTTPLSKDPLPAQPRPIPENMSPPLSPAEGHLSPGTPGEAASWDSRRGLRLNSIDRKGSTMSLLKLKDAGKAAPEISTDTTNAFGEVERTHTHDKQLRRPTSASSIGGQRHVIFGQRIRPAHSYSGHDPNILKLLDSLYLDNYPIELLEFGHVVAPIRGRPLQRAGAALTASGSWRPEGAFVAMLCEHTAAINRVVVAPDHKFFITGSDDGTVKIWDTGRLERNITHRSRLTHTQGNKIKVTSLCFVENTHCFVSTGSDGSVHVVRVEAFEQSGQSMTRYGRITLIREYQLPAGEYAIWSHHQQVDTQSTLILATNVSNIYGIELRTMKVVWSFQNPPRHGMPTCFCVDKKNHWLLLGTSMGIMDLWDLRFRMKLHSWGFAGGTPIHRIHQPVLRGSKRSRVTICGGSPGEIFTFDVERALVREAFKTNEATTREASLRTGSKLPVVEDLDDHPNRSGGFLSRFVKSSPMELGSPNSDKSVKAIAIGSQSQVEGADSKYIYMVSAGPDWKVRFFDSGRPDMCMIVNGLEYDELKPTYTMQSSNESVIISEKANINPSETRGTISRTVSSPAGTPSRKAKSSKNAIVSLQQQSLLRGHKDTISDVAMLDLPYGMVVSVDRSGIIYVFS